MQCHLAVQASREHYCVHPQISKKANKDEECQNQLKEDASCKFFKNVQKLYVMQTSHFLQVFLCCSRRALLCRSLLTHDATGT